MVCDVTDFCAIAHMARSAAREVILIWLLYSIIHRTTDRYYFCSKLIWNMQIYHVHPKEMALCIKIQVEIIILYSTGNRFKCIAIHIVKKYKFTIFAKIYKLRQLLLGNTLKTTLKYHTHYIYLFIFNVHCRIRKRTLASP